ncbi:hypothetical protein AD936_10595, partial [Gluconobacter japonicus]
REPFRQGGVLAKKLHETSLSNGCWCLLTWDTAEDQERTHRIFMEVFTMEFQTPVKHSHKKDISAQSFVLVFLRKETSFGRK